MSSPPFKTSDLGIAAFLITIGFPLQSSERRGKFVEFIFPSTAADVAESFYAGATAPASTFLDSYRKLRTIISNLQKGAKELCPPHSNPRS
jgi:hypothetical protein